MNELKDYELTKGQQAIVVEAVTIGKTMTTACELAGIPMYIAMQSINLDRQFAQKINIARESSAIKLIDEALTIVDEAGETTTDADGNLVQVENATNRAKLRVETRLRIAEIYNPLRFAKARDIILKEDLKYKREPDTKEESIAQTIRQQAIERVKAFKQQSAE